MNVPLAELGRKYGTDKVGHGYLTYFDFFFAPFRHQSFDLLEIGVHQGASIGMWHEYFPSARIVGVDIKSITLEDDLPRYVFVQGSQADPALLNTLAQEYRFRLIIDDGSHIWSHQILTFQTLFPHLESGGIYVCEDIHTSYGEAAERYSRGAPESPAAYFFRIAQSLVAGKAQESETAEDRLPSTITKRVRSMTFIRHAVIITT
jgi:hypothetical protein